MSSTDRQNRLLVAEDWKRIYQSFRNAEFKSYDFDNLRRIMISYIKENYPEDFNDYIESSEYIALIDLIAFLGQNLAFRIDLNARENFLDLAERKESILRLARLLSYNPKRNQCAHGLLKIVGISTTEDIISSNNNNLQGQTIIWNDPTNPDWNEHFTRVLNAALPNNNIIGRSLKFSNVNGVPTHQYRFNGSSKNLPVYPFRKNIKGLSTNFEVVSCDISNNTIIEEPPKEGNSLAFLYRDDGQGPSGDNTGFFCQFKQGKLIDGNFTINNPSTNQIVAIDSSNINDTDVWLYTLNNNIETKLWTRVDSVEGNNIIYNNISSKTKDIYSVLSRMNDKISLVFSDGVFGNIPRGNFKVYYRTSKNKNITISPDSMRGITVTIPYISRKGLVERITLILSLKYTVNNGSESESNDSIKRNAPATYYTQNRMITAEDYQLGPDSVSQEIIKSKTTNRASSGISRNLDLIDPTSKYSNTILFGDDGVLYKNYYDGISNFSFINVTDVEGLVYNVIEPLFRNQGLINYYMEQYPRIDLRDFNISWKKHSYKTNLGSGMFIGSNQEPLRLGVYSDSNLKYVKTNSLIKFVPQDGYVFLNGEMVPDNNVVGSKKYIWSKVIQVKNDGTQEGDISINEDVPDKSLMTQIITPLPVRLSNNVRFEIINQIISYKTFGLRYSRKSAQWEVVTQNNLDPLGNFSVVNSGDISNQQLDSSWLVIFRNQGKNYSMTYRSLNYIFESDRQMQFYYDQNERKNSAKSLKDDIITVLGVNRAPDSDFPMKQDYYWKIQEEYKDLSGYTNSKKVIVSLNDSDNDGVVDDPDIFNSIVNNDLSTESLIFLSAIEIYGKINDFEYIPTSQLNVIVKDYKSQIKNLDLYDDNQLFYFSKENSIEQFNKKTLSIYPTKKYKVYNGRSNIKFKYEHFSDFNSRIDPSVSNIMDTYLLSKNYDIQYRQWLSGGLNNEPLPPSSDVLYTSYGEKLRRIKSISDEVIYHPVKYVSLFGSHARKQYQATFKIVKNKGFVINDNELKSQVIGVINRYFSLENWDFGESFYFSEMASYVISSLSPKILSFLIVPNQHDLSFGALHEIHAKPDEIFISDATVENIQIINEITSTNLKSTGQTTINVVDNNNQITSSY